MNSRTKRRIVFLLILEPGIRRRERCVQKNSSENRSNLKKKRKCWQWKRNKIVNSILFRRKHQHFLIWSTLKILIKTPRVPSRNYWVSALKKNKLWIRKWKLMTIMQLWEKTSHWSRTCFSLATEMFFLLIHRKIWLKSCVWEFIQFGFFF